MWRILVCLTLTVAQYSLLRGAETLYIVDDDAKLWEVFPGGVQRLVARNTGHNFVGLYTMPGGEIQGITSGGQVRLITNLETGTSRRLSSGIEFDGVLPLIKETLTGIGASSSGRVYAVTDGLFGLGSLHEVFPLLGEARRIATLVISPISASFTPDGDYVVVACQTSGFLSKCNNKSAVEYDVDLTSGKVNKRGDLGVVGITALTILGGQLIGAQETGDLYRIGSNGRATRIASTNPRIPAVTMTGQSSPSLARRARSDNLFPAIGANVTELIIVSPGRTLTDSVPAWATNLGDALEAAVDNPNIQVVVRDWAKEANVFDENLAVHAGASIGRLDGQRIAHHIRQFGNLAHVTFIGHSAAGSYGRNVLGGVDDLSVTEYVGMELYVPNHPFDGEGSFDYGVVYSVSDVTGLATEVPSHNSVNLAWDDLMPLSLSLHSEVHEEWRRSIGDNRDRSETGWPLVHAARTMNDLPWPDPTWAVNRGVFGIPGEPVLDTPFALRFRMEDELDLSANDTQIIGDGIVTNDSVLLISDAEASSLLTVQYEQGRSYNYLRLDVEYLSAVETVITITHANQERSYDSRWCATAADSNICTETEIYFPLTDSNSGPRRLSIQLDAYGAGTAAVRIGPISTGEAALVEALFGDADLNGTVEFADFLALSANFGRSGGWSDGNFDYSETVDFGDFLALSANFGQTSNKVFGVVGAINVPEPTGGAVVAMVIVFFGLVARMPRN